MCLHSDALAGGPPGTATATLLLILSSTAGLLSYDLSLVSLSPGLCAWVHLLAPPPIS